jgi:hypothetical protein
VRLGLVTMRHVAVAAELNGASDAYRGIDRLQCALDNFAYELSKRGVDVSDSIARDLLIVKTLAA